MVWNLIKDDSFNFCCKTSKKRRVREDQNWKYGNWKKKYEHKVYRPFAVSQVVLLMPPKLNACYKTTSANGDVEAWLDSLECAIHVVVSVLHFCHRKGKKLFLVPYFNKICRRLRRLNDVKRIQLFSRNASISFRRQKLTGSDCTTLLYDVSVESLVSLRLIIPPYKFDVSITKIPYVMKTILLNSVLLEVECFSRTCWLKLCTSLWSFFMLIL